MKMSKENILKHLEELGKEAAEQANPGFYSVEDHGKAKRYQTLLPIIRHGYKMVQANNIIEGLKFLRSRVSGIEGNKINLLLIANTTGFAENSFWTVFDNDLMMSKDVAELVADMMGQNYR